MEFTVKFIAEAPNYAFDPRELSLGLRNLDEARCILNNSGIVKEQLVDKLTTYSDPSVTLTEEEARRSGRFKTQCDFEVHCISCRLNKFAFFTYKWDKEKNVNVTAELNTKELIAYWLKNQAISAMR